LGVVPFIRFLVYWAQGESQGHIQSLIFGSAMLVASLLSVALLVIADLLKTNRVLIEESLEITKELEYTLAVTKNADSCSDSAVPREDKEQHSK
jgi:hypothetical protein